uniref:Putative secreted protein n=1 Tax=Xenopsylla cheopis TaxID=163159 RepID=A0A6M2DY10_XENCH
MTKGHYVNITMIVALALCQRVIFIRLILPNCQLDFCSAMSSDLLSWINEFLKNSKKGFLVLAEFMTERSKRKI